MDILQDLVQAAKCRYTNCSVDSIREEALNLEKLSFPFTEAVRKPGLSLICEVKKASPSKGIIDDEFPYLMHAAAYEKGGADALSVLTEPTKFLGKDHYLQEITKQSTLPVLRKDFTIDEYQIYEARLLGSSAVLLICAILSEQQLKGFIRICETMGMDALVETHDEQEVRKALRCGASIIGVNNRDLKTFKVDLQTSIRLRQLVPPSVLFVSESGISSNQDAHLLASYDVDALLVGELLMRSKDKGKTIRELKV
ncbi:MAG: indole-3-glycerol phosphate synthase TrpC [Sphaerochaeta sp.]